MEQVTTKKVNIYTFTNSEVLKALGLKIPKSKAINFYTDYDYQLGEVVKLEVISGDE